MPPKHRRWTSARSLTSRDESARRTGTDRNETPAWLVKRMDFDGPWCWKTMDLPTLHRVHQRLSAFERMTYGEIEGRQNHQIPVKQLGKAARDRLMQLGFDDFDSLLSLRVTKTERIWGVKATNGISLLWWDPEHTVYPMNIANN